MISLTDLVSDTDYTADFCIEDMDASYYEEQSYLAQDCAEYQSYVRG